MRNRQWAELARTLGYPTEKDMLFDMYVTQKKSAEEIRKTLGISRLGVLWRLRLHEFEIRGRGGYNHVSRMGMRMHLMDQRIVLFEPIPLIAKLLRCSESAVYKYRRGTIRNKTVRESEKQTGELGFGLHSRMDKLTGDV